MTTGLPSYLTGPEPVKMNPETGKWFITIGQPGFNTRTNNKGGYPTKALATKVYQQHVAKPVTVYPAH